MPVDKATVRHIARLARIEVDDTDLDHLVGELSNILAWVEQLNEVDTSDVPPMTSVVDVDLPRRADTVTDGGSPDKILANAPVTTAGFFVVPKVIE
jgi:aspartyl-tRNA(Asn)/glutamyl-tRNA(Gln) amidotransferase subunit C